jgi:hypothetical protein
MGILNPCQFEILLPIRPLFLERRGTVANLNPAGGTVRAEAGVSHVAQVLAPGD